MTASLPVLRFSHFGPQVRHGISTRQGGVSPAPFDSLNLSGKVGDEPANAAENRERVVRTVTGQPEERLVVLTQVHGARVVCASAADSGRGILPDVPLPEEADGLITNEPGVPLQVLAADCVPLLLWDPVHHAIGAVHAGWRGTVAGTAVAAVKLMSQAYESRPGDLRVGIGPCIRACCYEVDAPVLDALAAGHPGLARRVTRPVRSGYAMFDLQEANRLQLLALGVPTDAIEVMPTCTFCASDTLFSDRKAARRTGRFGALIMLAE